MSASNVSEVEAEATFPPSSSSILATSSLSSSFPDRTSASTHFEPDSVALATTDNYYYSNNAQEQPKTSHPLANPIITTTSSKLTTSPGTHYSQTMTPMASFTTNSSVTLSPVWIAVISFAACAVVFSACIGVYCCVLRRQRPKRRAASDVSDLEAGSEGIGGGRCLDSNQKSESYESHFLYCQSSDIGNNSLSRGNHQEIQDKDGEPDSISSSGHGVSGAKMDPLIIAAIEGGITSPAMYLRYAGLLTKVQELERTESLHDAKVWSACQVNSGSKENPFLTADELSVQEGSSAMGESIGVASKSEIGGTRKAKRYYKKHLNAKANNTLKRRETPLRNSVVLSVTSDEEEGDE
ncbi:hypothetical protein BDR26DRAFT_872019 [Obelidium mucronatum]|nr:hypothetical protein BDR26DRAFT_872019 [Obelidium mucronatum]